MRVWIENAEELVIPAVGMLDLSDNDKDTMKNCIRLSNMVWAGYIDDELACIWGVALPTLLSSQAYLWLYTTPFVNQHRFIFIRHSQRVLEELLKEYPIIVGHMDVRNTSARQWLKWLGAQFSEPEGLKVRFWIGKRNG